MDRLAGLKRALSRRPRFSDIHPLTFLAIYLLAVPLFGALYHAQRPGSFYAQNLKYEPPALADALSVGADLRAAIEAGLALPPRSPQGPESWQIDPNSIDVDEVTVDEQHVLHFSVHFRATREKPGHAELGSTLRAQAPVRERVTSFPLSGPIISRWISPQPETVAKSVSEGLGISDGGFAGMLFRAKDPIVQAQAQALSWSPVEERRLRIFDQGSQGDPLAISGDVWRMVYFSAITITTVGYGDIIPLTGPARTLTGIEAVLGWLLAGLFLNAAATRLSRRSEAP